MTWQGSISYEQVQKLIEIFSVFTVNGWETPHWLCQLELDVINRDHYGPI